MKLTELHKDHFIRYRIDDNYWLRKLTICIAGICDKTTEPKIVFCADKLISGDIEFERFMPKMRRLRRNCIVLVSTENVLISESILDNVEEELKPKKDTLPIKEIVDIICKHCEEFQNKKIEKDVLSKYIHTADYLKLKPNDVLQYAIQERMNYKYPSFEFIILGMDSPLKPHIFAVNQNGDYKPWDSFGFAVTGIGSDLAFSEMTKWKYSIFDSLSLAITKVYFARKEAGRAPSIGKTTNFGVMGYQKKPKSKKIELVIKEIPEWSNFIEVLEKAFKNIQDIEMNVITRTANQIEGLMRKSKTKQGK